MTKANIDETLVKFTKTVVYVALMIFVILASLGKLGIETTSFAAILAAAGLAIGLSLQGTLGNFASGFMLILFRPFKVGDFVEAGGVDILAKDERILKDPAPTIGVSELADSSVNFVVRPWVKSGDYWPVLFDTQETVKLRFDAEGISIPYPQQDLHIVKHVKEESAA